MMKRMKKVGRWVGYALLVLLVAGIAFYGYAYQRGERKLNQVYPAPLPPISIPGDSAAIARGIRPKLLAFWWFQRWFRSDFGFVSGPKPGLGRSFFLPPQSGKPIGPG